METVYVPILINDITKSKEKASKTYRLDLDRGRIAGYVTGLEAAEQAIRKALITPRFKCLIYDNQYGSEIADSVMAKDATPEYTEAVIPGYIKDALLPDSRILDVYDVTIEFQDDAAYIRFTVNTVFGETEITEVI